ncbi:MAG: pyridoxal-phosphate dependent enzyme [FCB group bacterium]|nr:pyridoxal-phosphate dependent enzyme [FCB group bacterium]
MDPAPTLNDIKNAARRIKPFAHRTPVLTSQSINRIVGANLYFKCENFQKTGSFKFRGAVNAVLSLPDKIVRKDVATHSSGNHAAALSLAARLCGFTAHIVMPENAPAVKIRAVAGYGGKITFCKPNLKAREQTLEKVLRNTGARMIHPYNDPAVIAGQGTAALELLAEGPELDILLTPVGGGSLLSGTALAVTESRPQIHVIGVEPQQADDACRSFRSGKLIPVTNPDTIADGLRTSLGSLTFPIIKKRVHDIVTVSEAGIIQAMRLVWERMKIIIEPSAAVPIAAVLEKKLPVERKRIGVILSGGNIDLDHLPWHPAKPKSEEDLNEC